MAQAVVQVYLIVFIATDLHAVIKSLNRLRGVQVMIATPANQVISDDFLRICHQLASVGSDRTADSRTFGGLLLRHIGRVSVRE